MTLVPPAHVAFTSDNSSRRGTGLRPWRLVPLLAAIALSTGCDPDLAPEPVEEPPQCGVDGVFYNVGDSFPSSDGCNSCSCAADGTVGCTERACLPVESSCGGIAGLQCSDDEFCNFPVEARCGAADQLGSCRALPELCATVYAPVCGCDDITYGNECDAETQGVSVARKGACDELPTGSAGDSCGGFRVNDGTPDCEADMFCQHQAGALCGAADAPGQCVIVPDTCIGLFAPVCGCDGNTYSNSCEAAAAEMGILAEGECQ